MGIYDREYYRDETSGVGWFSGQAPACRSIILVNVVVWFFQWVYHDSPLESLLEAHSYQIFRQFHVWQLLTASFMHDHRDIFGLAFDMLILWWCGREMESMYGSREFTYMYLTAAIFSTFCWAVIDSGMGQTGVFIGATGPVYATAVLYTLYNPHREILLFYFLPVEMWVALLILLGFNTISVLSQMRGMEGPGSATYLAASLGGAAFGYFYKTYDLRWSRLLARTRRPRLRVVSPEPRDRVSTLPTAPARSASATSGRVAPPFAYPEEQLDARLDEVLAKIAREGRDGLTEEENRILEEASRRYRDRRSDRV